MLEGVRKVHLIGAGGIGVSAVGKLFLCWGKTVTGSDVFHNEQVDVLRHLGANISVGHSAENVKEDIGLIVYSPAVGEDNVERARARELGLTQMSYPQFLGELAKGYKTIAISGTHGKSTTTAMIGLILEAAGLDPTVIVGSKVNSWPDGNLRVGSSNLLVLEACEHMAGMLNIHPDIAVITNVEMDHPDFYRDLAHVQETFEKWKSQAKQVIEGPITDGPEFSLMIPVGFNLENARLAATVAKQLGASDEVIVKTLNAFSGLWRRFEKVSAWHGADIFSDYAHHPTAIKKTLQGAREFFPGRRIVLCFQPHQHARTKELFDDFVPSFDGADVLILVEIYAVAGRLEVAGEISSRDLVEAVKKRGKDVSYAADLVDAEKQLKDVIVPQDVVLVMGAGDIDDVARRLVV
ncbi:MAG: Mur ligase domain-containing protein [Patescibacteria group bacterium]